MKKIISILISCFMIFSAFSVSYAQEVENYGYIPYERADSEYFISPENEIQTLSLEEELPTSYDSRDYGFVSPVKNQGSGNTCWAFAAIGALESYMLKNYGEKDENGKVIDTNEFDFSENHMQYMMSSWNNNPLGYNVGTGSKSGGNSLLSSNYYMNDFGPVCEQNDAYTNINYRDYSATKDTPKSDYKVESVSFLPQIVSLDAEEKSALSVLESNLDTYNADPEKYAAYINLYEQLKNKQSLFDNRYSYLDDIKQMVKDYGSVICGIYFDRYNYKYLSENNTYAYCGNNITSNHQVLIVGWDDNFLDRDGMSDVFNFPGNNGVPPELKGAFIVKNSWGENNCDNGYFYLSYSDYNLFYDLMVITGVSKRNNSEFLYNLDPYGAAGARGYGTNEVNPVFYGNTFTRKTENEKLSAVRFYGKKGVTYIAYLVNASGYDYEGNANFMEFPEVNLYAFAVLTPEYTGYHTIYPMEEFKNKNISLNEKFSVILCADSDTIIPMYVEANDYTNESPIVSKVECEENQSFCRYGTMERIFEKIFPLTPVVDSNNTIVGYRKNGNFCIKAITETTDSYSEFEFANFTDEKGVEKTNFTAGEAVYIVPALNGANLDGKQIICVGYDGNKAVKMLQYKNFTSDEQNRFKIENIPSDFEYYTFYMYVWEMSGLKPLGEAIKVGTEK